MSKADITEKVETFRKKAMDDFIQTHGVKVGRAMEAFTKTSAMVRALQGFIDESDLKASDAKKINEVIHAYVEYVLGQYFTVLDLTQEQADIASDASYDLLKNIYEMFAANAAEPEKGSSEAGKPGIKAMH